MSRFDRAMRAALIAFVLGLAARCGPAITSDEFHCEAAMAHLANCCPSFPLHDMVCESIADGCGYGLLSELTVDEANCIRARSCDSIVADGLCEIVPTLPTTDRVCDNDCVDGDVKRAPVCP